MAKPKLFAQALAPKVEDVKKLFSNKNITSIITHLEKYTNEVYLSILFT